MPEMILLGWVHTLIAIVALITGYYSLVAYKVISAANGAGKIYLVCTLVTAVTALMIYQHGAFGPAHALAVLTLLALAAGLLVTRIPPLAGIARYFQAFCFSATLLFHMIPAITDALLRLPVGDPFLTNPEDPIIRGVYLLFVGCFVVGSVFQMLWLKRNTAVSVAG